MCVINVQSINNKQWMGKLKALYFFKLEKTWFPKYANFSSRTLGNNWKTGLFNTFPELLKNSFKEYFTKILYHRLLLGSHSGVPSWVFRRYLRFHRLHWVSFRRLLLSKDFFKLVQIKKSNRESVPLYFPKILVISPKVEISKNDCL